jgi:hypothetical protein
MSDDGILIPISDEQAKLGQEIINAFSGLGSFFKEALGSVPEDLIGYLGEDWLRFRRVRLRLRVRLPRCQVDHKSKKPPNRQNPGKSGFL